MSHKPLKIAEIVLLVVIGGGLVKSASAHTFSSPDATTNALGIFGAYAVATLGTHWVTLLFLVFALVISGIAWTVIILRKRLSEFN